MAYNLIYEVECQLDPDIVADYDAWLPGHVRDVLACPGFHGANIEIPETPPGQRQRRRIRYRVESVAALDHYLENDATRLRTETAQRFGGRVQCERRVFKPRHELTPATHDPKRCLNCSTVVTGKHCAQCGQAADMHVLSMKEVAGDVTHSLLHLDSRVWRTLRKLALRPGELTREFIAGRHQEYLPPFRLYLAISILFFALSAVLPGPTVEKVDAKGNTVNVPVKIVPEEDIRKELEAEGVDPAKIDEVIKGGGCTVEFSDNESLTELEQSFTRACKQMRADGGKAVIEVFVSNAPKLMFLFLPLMAAVALLFYWKPRRLYAEHLVLFLHNHAFTFLLLGVSSIVSAVSELPVPFLGVIDLINVVLTFYLFWYVYRSMRVVYAEGRLKTTLKYISLSSIYFVLLGVTMMAGLIYAMLSLS